MARVRIIEIPIDFVQDEPSWDTEPEHVLRAKAELLAEFLGCDVDSAERVILDRITDLGV